MGNAAPIRLTGVQLNPADPTLTMQNSGTSPVSLAGWKLRVGTTAITVPANAMVGANQTVTLHLGNGTSSGADVYLGSDAMTLLTALRPGVRVMVENAQGATVSEFALPA